MPNAKARRNAQERRRQEAWLWDPILGDNRHRGEPHEPEWQVLARLCLTDACIEPALHLFNETLATIEASGATASQAASADAPPSGALEASPFFPLPAEVLAHVARCVLAEPLINLHVAPASATFSYAMQREGRTFNELVREGVPGDPPLRVRFPYAHQRRAADLCALVRTCRAFRDCVYAEAPELRLEAAARWCACLPPRVGGVPTPFVAQLERQQVCTIELALLASAFFQVVNCSDPNESEYWSNTHGAFNEAWSDPRFRDISPLVRRVLGDRVPRLTVAHRGPAQLCGATPEGVAVAEITPQDVMAAVHLTSEEPEVFSPQIGVRVRGRVLPTRKAACVGACGDYIALAEEQIPNQPPNEVQVWRVSTNECLSKLFVPGGCERAWMRPDPVATGHVQLHVQTLETEQVPHHDGRDHVPVLSVAVERWAIAPDGTVRRSLTEPARLKPGDDKEALHDTSSKWTDTGPVSVFVNTQQLTLKRGVSMADDAVATASSGCLAIACTRVVLRSARLHMPGVLHDTRYFQRIAVLDPDDDAFHLVGAMDTRDVRAVFEFHKAYVCLSPDGTVLLHLPREQQTHSRPTQCPMSIYQRTLEAQTDRVWHKVAEVARPTEAIRKHLPMNAAPTITGTWSPCGKYYVRVHARGLLILDVQETIHNHRNYKCNEVKFDWVPTHRSTAELTDVAWSNGIWLETGTMGILHLGLGDVTA